MRSYGARGRRFTEARRRAGNSTAPQRMLEYIGPTRNGAGDGNSTRSLTRLLRTSFPIQASRNGLDCGLKSSAWSTQAVAGDPKRAKHIHQQPEHRISFRSLSVYWHTTPQVATDRRAASSKDRLIIDRRGLVFHPLDEPHHGLRGFALAAQQVGREHRWGAGQGTNGDVRAL